MSNQILTKDYSAGSVGTSSYVSLGVTSIPTAKLYCTDTSGKLVKLAANVGAVTPAVNAHLTDQSITYTARVAGPAGNNISIELVDPGVADSPLSVDVNVDAISVSLETSSPVAASVEIQSITYTAKDAGSAGNSITVTYVDPGSNDSPLDVSVSGTDITVSLETDSGGAFISNNDDIVAAIQNNVDADALVDVSTSDGQFIPIENVQTPLANGADYNLISTSADVVAALSAASASNAIISSSTSNGTTVLAALSPTNLASGADASTAIVDLFQLPVSGQKMIPLPNINYLPVGTTLYLKAISATANSGFCTITVES